MATTTGFTAIDWVTREDVVALTRTSIDTIRRDEKKHGLETRRDDAGRVLVSVADFIRIGRLREADLTTGSTPGESAAILRSRETLAQLRAQLARAEGGLEQAQTVIDTLREQLATKDRQLTKRDDHIAQLTALLGQMTAHQHALSNTRGAM